MAEILHITTRDQWQQARQSDIYLADSLRSEGFIHCSLPEQVADTANRFFPGTTGLILLVINPHAVEAEIRYEGETERFPHIYGPLNLDAVTRVIDFPPRADGTFDLPDSVG